MLEVAKKNLNHKKAMFNDSMLKVLENTLIPKTVYSM